MITRGTHAHTPLVSSCSTRGTLRLFAAADDLAAAAQAGHCVSLQLQMPLQLQRTQDIASLCRCRCPCSCSARRTLRLFAAADALAAAAHAEHCVSLPLQMLLLSPSQIYGLFLMARRRHWISWSFPLLRCNASFLKHVSKRDRDDVSDKMRHKTVSLLLQFTIRL